MSTLFDLDAAGLSGPSTFSKAGPEKDITAPGGVTLSGGVLLTGATNDIANRTTVYGSAQTSSALGVTADPSLKNPVTITSAQPLYYLSFELDNGLTTPATYDITDDAGDVVKVTIPANFNGGKQLVSLAAPKGATQFFVKSEASPWDFELDSFSYDASNSTSTITDAHRTTTTGEKPVAPFADVNLSQTLGGTTQTVTISLTGGGGVLSGDGLQYYQDGSYTLTAADAATLEKELAALSFTPFATQTNTKTTTTFTITQSSDAGKAVSDSSTSVVDTSGGTIGPQPTLPTPVGPAPGNPVLADAVSIDQQVSYNKGVFTLTGRASSAAGVAGVEISAVLDDGTRQDLGAATVNADGTFTFADTIGAHQQSFLVATETDGAGAQTASTDPGFSLSGGLSHAGGYKAQQVRYSSDGSAETLTDLFKSDSSQKANLLAPDQTVDSWFFDTFNNRGQPDSAFVFDPGYGLDVINGFRVDDTDHDTLSFKGSDFGDSIAAVLQNTHQTKGGSCVIVDPTSGDTVRLAGITKAQLTANQGDITFHA